MPEWLRLFKSAPIKGVGAARRAVTETVPSVIKSAPEVLGTQALGSPSIARIAAPRFTFTEPSFLALPSAQKQYVQPLVTPASDDAIRTLTRRHVGLPDDKIVPSYMSFDELQHLLTTQNASPAIRELATINQGLQPGTSGYIDDFRTLLGDASRSYWSARKKVPYKSMNEVLKDEELFGNFGFYGVPDDAIAPLAQEYVIRGFGLPSRYDWLQSSTTKYLFNKGVIPVSHPFVQGYISDYSRSLPELPESFMDDFGTLTGSRDAFENSEEAAMRLWPLVTKGVVPNSKLDKQLQLTYGRRFKTIVDSGKFRDLLTKIENIETLPEKERRWLQGQLNIAYGSPTPGSLVGLKPWNQEQIKAIANAAKRIYGIDVSPQELLQLYKIENPEYNKVVEVLNDAKHAFGKKDLKVDDLRVLYDTTDSRYADLEKILSDAKAKFGENFTVKDLPWVYDRYNPNYPALAKRIRPRMEVLPGDLKHFSWFQVRNARDASFPGVDWSLPVFNNWTSEQKTDFAKQAEQNWLALKEKEAKTVVGLQEKALSHSMPAETATAEQHTSADSYRIGAKNAGKSSNYGTEPGQIQMVEIPDRGDYLRKNGNNFQLNRLRYNDAGELVSDAGIPEIEKLTFNKNDMEALISRIRHFDSAQLKTFLESNPGASALIDKAISAAKALHNRDLLNVRPAFELVNRKHRKLGLAEIAGPGENDFPKLSTEEGFYDEDNVKMVLDLIKSLHRDAGYNGFAINLRKRTPYIILQHKEGGKIPNWAKRYIQ